ncbi:transcriptional activator hap3 [Spiromyces aspiralis]|uniref:Transcriptional activator hap3 n=1 Tax=Spiromyces aspiralis TaxID=68401 RepID=A0ACC1HJV7_9FUNG|nr:transcriptional activator hap3 [Spiromyces aspiralis]
MSDEPKQLTPQTPGGEEDIKEQDRFLPIANVARIMKRALPENAKIAKEAKETVQECVSEFISFITSEASDRCQQEKRKTINGEDILWAMQSLGFENYADALKVYLTKYREAVKLDKDSHGHKHEESTPGAQQEQDHQDHQQQSSQTQQEVQDTSIVSSCLSQQGQQPRAFYG